MKKIIISAFTIILLIFNLTISVYAEFEFDYEEIPKESQLLISNYNFDSDSLLFAEGYLIDVNGKQYYYNKKVINDDFCFFAINISDGEKSSPDYIWTGEAYFVRANSLDGYWYDPRKYAQPLRLVDKNGGIIKEYDLRENYGQHAIRIGYNNNVYYCELGNKIIIKSTDFENWQETTEEVPICFSEVSVKKGEVALNDDNFYRIIYENFVEYELFSSLGEWLIYRDDNGNFYFTNDAIYFVKINYPVELLEVDKENGFLYNLKCVYEYNNKIIIDFERKYDYTTLARRNDLTGRVNFSLRLSIDKEKIYQQLNELKSATHVQLNDEYLGFEVPPVTESDRTLVPMRFLFEQMGADVAWNNDTQTATATLSADSGANGGVQTFGLSREKSVTFGIDDTTAVVNGESAEMDVPARLVDGKTMVPLRFLSESLGYNVEWDEETNTAIVTTD